MYDCRVYIKNPELVIHFSAILPEPLRSRRLGKNDSMFSQLYKLELYNILALM